MTPRIRLAGALASLYRFRQRRRLARTLESARELPGYRTLPAARDPHSDPHLWLREFPVLERRAVQADPDAFCDPGVPSLSLSSSGSTGTPLALRLDRRARWRRRRQFGVFFALNGWRPWRRALTIRVATDPSARLGSELLDRSILRRRTVISILDPPQLQFEALRRTDPEILHGLPSALEELAHRAEATGWRPTRLRRIFTVSEALTPPVRSLLERVLGAPVLDTYAASEALVGWECGHKSGIHVLGSNVVLEVIAGDGTPTSPGAVGQVLVTTLDNRAMPLLRYAIGDMAIAPGPESCACGRPGPVIPRVLGREMPFFEVGGEPVSPWGMVARMYEIDGIGQFQLLQDAPDRLLVRVRRPRSGPAIDRSGITRLAISELGPPIQVEVREVDVIEPGRNGKAAPALISHPPGVRPDRLAS